MVAPFRLAGIRVIAELRQLLIEGLHGFSLLPQQIVDDGLLAVLDRLQVRKDFFNIVTRFFFWHSASNLSTRLAGIAVAQKPVEATHKVRCDFQRELHSKPGNERDRLHQHGKL